MSETKTAETPDTDKDTSMEAVRRDILEAALPLVPFEGWTVPMLRNAAEKAGHSRADQRNAFPRGVIDLVLYYSQCADEEMVSRLEAMDLSSLKVRERVTAAVRARIEAVAASKDAARRAAGLLALPFHGASSTTAVYRTVDAVWRAIGDTSTDFNFYSKRALLAGVYTSTLMYWFNDTSEGSAETWAFLDRRIGDVMQIEKVKAKAREGFAKLPDPLGVLAKMRYGTPGRRR